MTTRVLAKYDRPAWMPVTDEREGAVCDSKFGGAPYMPEGAVWPACEHCSLPLQFVLQLDLDRLPVSADELADLGFFGNLSNKMLQLFICEDHDCLCEDNMNPDMRATQARVVAKSASPRSMNPPLAEPFPARLIAGWERKVDPIPMDELMWVDSSGIDDADIHADEQTPHQGDKLLGWPNWAQECRHARCECGTGMSFVFQIDSQKNIPLEFGHAGVGQILVCPVDLKAMFTWDSR